MAVDASRALRTARSWLRCDQAVIRPVVQAIPMTISQLSEHPAALTVFPKP